MKETRYTAKAAGPLLPFLLERAKGGRNHVKGLLARGQVTVDGEIVTRHDHPLAPGQVVAVAAQAPERPPFPVLYEDGRILVIAKPAGLLTVASDGEKARTAYRLAAGYVQRRDPRARVFVVHRLDRDTSGVLLFAKDEGARRAYQEDWNSLALRRGYLAVTEGAPPRPSGTVRSLLRETSVHRVYSGRGGKEAVTHYTTRSKNGEYALLEVSIDTGRKNQIRAHLSELGCPVAGDRMYGAATDPPGPAVPPRPRAGADRPLYRRGAHLPGGAPRRVLCHYQAGSKRKKACNRGKSVIC